MSQLPNAALAHVDDVKVGDYLLNPGNPQNQGKADRFGQYGFARDQRQVLADALQGIRPSIQLFGWLPPAWGQARNGVQSWDARPQDPMLKVGMAIGNGQNCPRLVTAG